MPQFACGDVVKVVDGGLWDSGCFWPDGQKHSLYEVHGRRGEVVSPFCRKRVDGQRNPTAEGVLVRLYEQGTYNLESAEILFDPRDLQVIPPLELLAEA